MKIKDRLKYLWWGYVGNPWWWAMVGFVLVLIIVFVGMMLGIASLISILSRPEILGEYVGKIIKGINSVK